MQDTFLYIPNYNEKKTNSVDLELEGKKNIKKGVEGLYG